ncbi:MAG: CoA-binding protein [Chloroflexota bacterium]|nr:CoA-binding protein [Chloroflexota bacterium]
MSSHQGQATENYARQEDIEAALKMRRIAVVGLSSDRYKPSHGVARYLQAVGYDITPVNPTEDEVLGERAYASLRDLPEPPELVDVFRRPEYVDEVVEDAIAAGAKAIWIQSGIIDYEAARKAREAGLITVMDRCLMVEHRMRSY